MDVPSGPVPSSGPPLHPGEVLLEHHLRPNNVRQKDAAARLGLHPSELSRFIHGHRDVDAKLALRLVACGFGTSAHYWLALQERYDLWRAMNRARQQI